MLRNANLNSRGDETSEDRVFRYKLDLESRKTPVYHHRLAELVRATLDSLLNVVVPLEVGEDVKIDAFRWLMDKEKVYQVFPQSDSLSCSSPSVVGGQGVGLRA
ncbi:MAG: hypothetical protein KAW81_04965, partial [Dehalococcoidia bacterium]|nr:hypothetical protein [Dehalococcoidia bacterium]